MTLQEAGSLISLRFALSLSGGVLTTVQNIYSENFARKLRRAARRGELIYVYYIVVIFLKGIVIHVQTCIHTVHMLK
jgi:hypothetical protein